MGGGLSRHELAAAVSEAGGLGTIAVNGAEPIRRELSAARALTSRPIAVNVLLPFARRDWFDAAAEADVVVTFWGRPRRRTGGVWMHQCGSVAEARAAHAAGADAAILQGVEAGGHVRGDDSGARASGPGRSALPPGYPLLLAGGIADGTTCGRRSRRARQPRSPAPASCSRRRVARTPPTSSACWRVRRRSSPSSSAPAGRRRTESCPTPRRPTGWAAGDEGRA